MGGQGSAGQRPAQRGFAPLADALEQSEVRPAKPSFYGVKSREFQD
ncbi:hypothetical protein [Streptomyces sp. NBC_01435]|nr:hypothetical protein [Streptomyces sp. NBC_01435]